MPETYRPWTYDQREALITCVKLSICLSLAIYLWL